MSAFGLLSTILIGLWLAAGTVCAIVMLVQEKPFKCPYALENTICIVMLGYMVIPLLPLMLICNAVSYVTGNDSCWGTRAGNRCRRNG